jgi:hypothetical protein
VVLPLDHFFLLAEMSLIIIGLAMALVNKLVGFVSPLATACPVVGYVVAHVWCLCA